MSCTATRLETTLVKLVKCTRFIYVKKFTHSNGVFLVVEKTDKRGRNIEAVANISIMRTVNKGNVRLSNELHKTDTLELVNDLQDMNG